MQASFNKIMGFMESVDERLNNLEKVTQSILHNQNSAPVLRQPNQTSVTPHPPPSVQTSNSSAVVSYPPYAMPIPGYSTSTSSSGSVSYPTLQTADEADALRKIEQFEEDQKLAKRLQEELEQEAKRSSTSSSSSSKSSSSTTTKKQTSTPKEESVICPICSKQITLAEIESHADQCLESSSTTKKDANGQPTAAEKTGFFASLFGKKDAAATPTPTPAPTPVATKPAPTVATTRPTTTTAPAPTTVAHMPNPYQQPGNPSGQFYQMPYMYPNTAYTPYGYSQYPQPGPNGQQGYYYYPGQQPPTSQPPKKP